MEKSPRRACPLGIVSWRLGRGAGAALRSLRSIASGWLKSPRSTEAPPGGAGAIAWGLGLPASGPICWATKARTVSKTPTTRRRAQELACAEVGAPPANRASASRIRLAVRMGHPPGRDREEPSERENAAHVHERQGGRGDRQATGRLDQAPESVEPGLL